MKGNKFMYAYLFTVLTILILIISAHYIFYNHIQKNRDHAHIINLSGKQRILSQRIVSKALEIEKLEKGDEIEEDRTELKNILERFKRVHYALQSGNEQLEVPPLENKNISLAFQKAEPLLNKIIKVAGQIANNDNDPETNRIDNAILDTLLTTQEKYLSLQDGITNQFERTAKQDESFLAKKLLWFVIASAIIILLEVWFVFVSVFQRLKRSKKEIKSIASRFQELYHRTPAMLHSIDSSGKLVMVSDFWLKKTGYTREEVLGKTSAEFLTKESQEYAKSQILPEFFKTGKCYNVSYQFVKKDGSIMDILLSATSQESNPGHSLAIITDVTENVANFKKLQNSLKELRYIDKIIQTSLKNPSFQELIKTMLETYKDIIGRGKVDFYFYNKEDGSLNLFNDDPSENLKVDSQRFPVSQSYIYALTSGDITVFSGENEIKNILEYLHKDDEVQQNIKHLLLVPICTPDNVFGLLTLTFLSDIDSNLIESLNRFTNGIKAAFVKTLTSMEREKLVETVEQSTDAIVGISLEGKINSWNKGAEQVFGYNKWEILNKNIGTLTHTDENKKLQKIMSSIEKNKCYISESIWYNKHGQPKYVSLSIFPIRDEAGSIKEISAIIRDITHKKIAEQKLIRNEALLSHAQKLARIGSWEYDLSSGTVICSEEFYDILGLEKREILGVEDGMQSIHPDDEEKVLNTIKKTIDKKKSYRLIHRVLNKKSEIRYIESRGSVVSTDMPLSPYKMYGTVMDITQQIKMQKVQKQFREQLEKKVMERTNELKQSEERLKSLLSKEKELSELKSHFVSIASHQFRTPMAIIQSNSELIDLLTVHTGEGVREKFTKANIRIKQEIKRMIRLMDEVLILGKMTSNNFKVNPKKIDIKDICQRQAEQFNAIQKDNRKLIFTSSGDPVLCLLDENLIDHALNNFLTNAFKYSIGTDNPEMHLHYNEDTVRITIKDYGIGIPKESQKNLFQPFYRASNTNEIKGSGLGLHIAKEYINLNKGTVELKSKENEGTEITLIFSAIKSNKK